MVLAGAWHVSVPGSRSGAVCSTCCGNITAKTPRVRRGGAHARVHHIACVASQLGVVEDLAGWQQLSASQQ
eukprot:653781-Karenia_brevis.AAC.1